MNREKLLAQLVERLLHAYGRDLRSVVLYGSAAGDDFDEKRSDLNVLCVLRDLGVESLQKAEQTANWWRSLGNPAPLLFAPGEIERATDAFPIEFLDIQQQHRVLHGEDPVAGLTIAPAFHRVQVEHEIRAKLLALRQRYLGIHRNKTAVLKLMVDALPSLAALFRHAVIVTDEAGRSEPGGSPRRLSKNEALATKRGALEAAARRFGFDPEPFLAALELREGKRKRRQVDADSTFQGYYAGIARVCEQVDAFVKQKAETK